MPEPLYLTDAQDREQHIASLLHSTFAEPNRRTFPFVEGTLYIVARMAWDAQLFDYRPGLVWVNVFPPSGNKTGISWQEPTFVGDEYTARHDLTAIDEAESVAVYAAAMADYQRSKSY